MLQPVLLSDGTHRHSFRILTKTRFNKDFRESAFLNFEEIEILKKL
jgi:hypothetical protein